MKIKDCDFDELEKRYSHLTRFIQLFASDSQNFRKQLHDTVICQFNVAQNVADLYRSVFFIARFKGGNRKSQKVYLIWPHPQETWTKSLVLNVSILKVKPLVLLIWFWGKKLTFWDLYTFTQQTTWLFNWKESWKLNYEVECIPWVKKVFQWINLCCTDG